MHKSKLINVDVLSEREREVACYAADGIPNKIIARKLNITEGTVKLHLHRVYQKLGIKGRHILAAKSDSTETTIAARDDRVARRVLDRKIGHPPKLAFAISGKFKIQRQH